MFLKYNVWCILIYTCIYGIRIILKCQLYKYYKRNKDFLIYGIIGNYEYVVLHITGAYSHLR